ncbi:MAG: tetratricopeptide repeat protein [Planctomycetes bacterium]|nr:tetratricopeptide repeat protein [Planctomycetota bacterium]
MRKLLLLAVVLVLAVVVTGCASQTRSGDSIGRTLPAATNGSSSASIDDPELSLEQMLEEDDFNLARALLLFSEEYYPEFAGVSSHDIDIDARLKRFDTYTTQLRDALRRDNSPRQRVRTLVDFIHIKLGLRFDGRDQRGENPDNLFFDRVLQNRYGYCVTLSLAYLVFGQGAGLDVSGVRFPGHFAVLYKDTDTNGTPYETILETTDFGDTRDEVYYWSEYRFSATSVENGVYLTPMTDKEIVGTLYNNLAGITYAGGDSNLAIQRYTRALELAPNNAEALYNRAIVESGIEEDRDALKDLNEAIRLDPNFTLAFIARSGLLWSAGERDAAFADLAEAKRKRPEWPQTWMLEGMFQFEQGDLDAARTSFSRVLDLDPEYSSAHLALAELEYKAGNDAEARKHEAAAGVNK